MISMRRRNFMLVFAFIVLVPFTILLLYVGPGTDITSEQSLSQRLAEYQIRVQYLESMYRARQEDVAILSQYLGLSVAAATAIGNTETNASTGNGTANGAASAPTILDSLSPETRAVIRNMSNTPRFPASLRLPSAFHFMPHLLDDASSLKPAHLRSRGRQGVAVVLGVPTVRRDKHSYLLSTLQNLIENMDESEQNQTLIVVFIGETDSEYVQLVSSQIEMSFGTHVDSGLIEVLSPPAAYYPNMEQLRQTLNDPPERVRWRSKQNLDFAFLMAYAQPKATFYVQLEDDILTKRGFVTIMKDFAYEKTVHKDAWFVLDFCQLGFIGKMFKSTDLPWLITFFQMFYNDKPADWLLEQLIHSKVHNWDKDMKYYKQEKAKIWLHYRRSLFQHIGTSSSLKGKIQKLKDKQFGKVPAFVPHRNPPARVHTNIATYKGHTLKRAYAGESFYWGLFPQAGDQISIVFDRPFAMRRYLFRSGNSEHPSDRLYNANVEVLPETAIASDDGSGIVLGHAGAPKDSASNGTLLSATTAAASTSATTSTTSMVTWAGYKSTVDGFLIVGTFDELGLAKGVLDVRVGPIREVRLRIHTESDNWAILSEIWLQDSLTDRS